jgi:hypothetical protein
MISLRSCGVVSRRRSSHDGRSDAQDETQDETRGRRARQQPCRGPRQIFGLSTAMSFEASVLNQSLRAPATPRGDTAWDRAEAPPSLRAHTGCYGLRRATRYGAHTARQRRSAVTGAAPAAVARAEPLTGRVPHVLQRQSGRGILARSNGSEPVDVRASPAPAPNTRCGAPTSACCSRPAATRPTCSSRLVPPTRRSRCGSISSCSSASGARSTARASTSCSAPRRPRCLGSRSRRGKPKLGPNPGPTRCWGRSDRM